MTHNADGDLRLQRFHALKSQLLVHPGEVAYRRWRALRQVDQVLQINESELLSLLQSPSHNPDLAVELFQNTRDPAMREAFYVELFRLLHNYLAAAKTLVDHTRNLVKKESNAGFLQEYERRKDYVSRQPATAFIHGLRNHLLHHELPPFTSIVTPRDNGRQGFDHTIMFTTKTLVANRDWANLAKKYTLGKVDRFALRDVVETYSSLISDLQEWMFAQFEMIHADVLTEADLLREELNYLFR